jgi:hypothetical protein
MFQIKFALSFSLCMLTTLTSANMAIDFGKECFWKNTNYIGFDVERLRNISTANHCQTKCTKFGKCRHWSFDARNKICVMKAKSKGRVSAITWPVASDPNSFAGWVSGPRRCKCAHKSLIFNGTVVQAAKKIVQKTKECQRQCKLRPQCVSYSWSKHTKECKLLASVTSVSFDPKWSSGSQSCKNNAEEDDDSEEDDSEEGEGEEEYLQYASASFKKENEPVTLIDIGDAVGSSSGISTIGFVLAMFFSF